MKVCSAFIAIFVLLIVLDTGLGQSDDDVTPDKSILRKPNTLESTKPKKFVPEAPAASFVLGNVERRSPAGRVRDYGVASDYPRTNPASSSQGGSGRRRR